jgi:DNA-binding transcriptional MocR family regulator
MAALEAAGIEFIGSPTDRPGISLSALSISAGNKRR